MKAVTPIIETSSKVSSVRINSMDLNLGYPMALSADTDSCGKDGVVCFYIKSFVIDFYCAAEWKNKMNIFVMIIHLYIN
jgi:hypothetical protein